MMVDKKVFIVDDDVKVLEVLSETLGSLGLDVTCFVRPTKCLEQLRYEKCDLLITDLRMPDMDGIKLLSNSKRYAPLVPVLVTVGYCDVPTAVKIFKKGASDILEKPLSRSALIRAITSILREDASNQTCLDGPLTSTQMKVLKLVIDGKSNEEIAALLGRSIRAVEVHRANMMQMPGVNNLIDLIKRAVELGLMV